MKESTNDATGKTSRRHFARTVASALVAVPVISALTSCATQPDSNSPTNRTNETPTPQPSPTPDPKERGGDPPVIIDGGSLTILTPAVFKREDDDAQAQPKEYDHKFTQKKDASIGRIKRIRIINDYGDEVYPEYLLKDGETAQVHLWKQKATRGGDDEEDTDTASYPNINASAHPDVIIQGGKLEIRMDKNFLGTRKRLFKRRGRNHKRYHVNDWQGGDDPFRIGKVKVLVNNALKFESTTANPDQADDGFRVIFSF